MSFWSVVLANLPIIGFFNFTIPTNRFDLIVFTEILAKYSEILEKHMGKIVSEYIFSLIENLENLVKATLSFRFNLILADYDDHKFVDYANTSNADFIVTEDRHFDELKKINFPKVEIKSIHYLN